MNKLIGLGLVLFALCVTQSRQTKTCMTAPQPSGP